MQNFSSLFRTFNYNLLVQRSFSFLNAAIAMTNLDSISSVHLAPFVIMLPKWSKHSTCPADNPIFLDMIIMVNIWGMQMVKLLFV